MAWLVLLGSGFLLASLTTLQYSVLQFSGLALSFLLAGVAFHKQKFLTYLFFVFLYPLLPSQSAQLSTFDFLQFGFLCIAFWWAFLKIRSRDSKFPKTSLSPFIALLIAIFSLSMILSLLRQHYVTSEVFLLKLKDSWNVFDSTASFDFIALRTLIYFFEGVIFFYITVDIVDFLRIGKTVRTMIYSAFLVASAGILQYAFKLGLLEYWIRENPNIPRINSTFSDPNSLGTYLASILSLIAFAFLAARHKRRSLYYAGSGMILIALVFTASRAAWAATFLTLLIAPVALKLLGINVIQHLKEVFGRLIKLGPYVAISGLILLFGAAAILNYTSSQPESLMKMLLFTFNPNLSADAILKGRIEFWKTAVSVFREYPFFGSGPGSFRSFLNAPYFVIAPENAHNYFLQILAETGVPGFVLFCLIIGFVFKETRKQIRTHSSEDFLLRFGLLAGLIAFLLTSLTGHPLLLLKLQLFFWSLIGLLLTDKDNGAIEQGTRRSVSRRRWPPLLIAGLLLLVPFFLQASEILKTRRLSAYEYGYHRWEKDERGFLFRWTMPTAVSVLDVQGEVLAFRLRQLNPEVKNRPGAVKLYLNNQLFDTVHFFDTGWKSLSYFMPPLSDDRRITLRIVADQKYIPADRNDRRQLGIAIQNFEWRCPDVTPIGVYEQEREGEKSYYWTGSQASFLVDRSGSDLTFRILPNPLVEMNPVNVQLFWDRTEIQRRTFMNPKWETIDLKLPDGGGSSGVLTMRVSPTANLKQTKRGEDFRDLGIRVELPFQWSGRFTPPVKRIEYLRGAKHYGVINYKNHPFRLFLFPLNQFSPNLRVATCNKIQEQRHGLMKMATPEQGDWKIIYPDVPFTRSAEAFVWKSIEKDVRLPEGPVLIRMSAAGVIEGGDPPIVSLRIDDREVARQPIIEDRWIEYYFPVDLPNGGSKIKVEFLNDYYLAYPKVDRNVLISQIAYARSNPLTEPGEGWEIVNDQLVIAESVDRNFPFLPRSRCYTIETEK